MDLRNVINWEIPEGNVIKVTDSNGVVIWREYPDLPKPLSNEIYYITSDENIITPYQNESVYKAQIQSNVYYKDLGYGKITFTQYLEYIGYLWFSYCNTLVKMRLPNTVKQIHSEAFRGCENLIEINIPKNTYTSKIEDGAFRGCYKLRKAVIPDNITYIEEYAFYGCKIKYLDLPRTLTGIGNHAFEYCGGIKTLILRTLHKSSIPDVQLNTFGSNTYAYNIYCYSNDIINELKDETYDYYWTHIINSDTIFHIIEDEPETPNSIQLPNEIWYTSNDGNIVELSDDYVTKYGFEIAVANTYINGVGRLVFDSDIYEIRATAFKSRDTLTSVTIPRNVTSIGSNAFYNCKNIQSIICNAMTAPTIKNDTFEYTGISVPETQAKILYVPQNSTGYGSWLEQLKGFELQYITE